MEWSTHQDNVKYSSDKGRYKKPYGEKNPNYGNTKLKEYFKNNPDEKMKLARPGSQNGRATPIRMFTEDSYIDFGYIGECANYLIDNNFFPNIKFKSLCSAISQRLNTNKKYHGLTFQKI